MPKVDEKQGEKIRVQQIRPPKMKDKPKRNRIIINLKKTFGFMPEIMFIDKVPNVTNTIVISAVLPDAMAKELEEKEKAAEAANSKTIKIAITPEGVKKIVASSAKDVNGDKKPNKRSTPRAKKSDSKPRSGTKRN